MIGEILVVITLTKLIEGQFRAFFKFKDSLKPPFPPHKPDMQESPGVLGSRLRHHDQCSKMVFEISYRVIYMFIHNAYTVHTVSTI